MCSSSGDTPLMIFLNLENWRVAKDEDSKNVILQVILRILLASALYYAELLTPKE